MSVNMAPIPTHCNMQVQSPLTRARTVSVFRQCIISLFMVKDQHPQAVKEAVASVLPVWLEAFKVLLSIGAEEDVSRADNWDALAVRIQIFKVWFWSVRLSSLICLDP